MGKCKMLINKHKKVKQKQKQLLKQNQELLKTSQFWSDKCLEKCKQHNELIRTMRILFLAGQGRRWWWWWFFSAVTFYMVRSRSDEEWQRCRMETIFLVSNTCCSFGSKLYARPSFGFANTCCSFGSKLYAQCKYMFCKMLTCKYVFFVLTMYTSLTLCMDLYVCKCMFMQYMQVHVLYYCHYIIVCVWCMQCIIMPLYNACYDSCGCILCMQKINNVHVCTCVCASVCVYVCIHNVHVCACVCAWLSVCVCVCVCACPFCQLCNQLQSVFNPKEWL